MIIEIKDEHAEELFEILCEIPYREANGFDWEPPTERPAGIDDILDQMCEEFIEDEMLDVYYDSIEEYELEKDFVNCEHEQLQQFSEYIDNVEFTDYGMTYNNHKLCICRNCEKVIDVVDANKMWLK